MLYNPIKTALKFGIITSLGLGLGIAKANSLSTSTMTVPSLAGFIGQAFAGQYIMECIDDSQQHLSKHTVLIRPNGSANIDGQPVVDHAHAGVVALNSAGEGWHLVISRQDSRRLNVVGGKPSLRLSFSSNGRPSTNRKHLIILDQHLSCSVITASQSGRSFNPVSLLRNFTGQWHLNCLYHGDGVINGDSVPTEPIKTFTVFPDGTLRLGNTGIAGTRMVFAHGGNSIIKDVANLQRFSPYPLTTAWQQYRFQDLGTFNGTIYASDVLNWQSTADMALEVTDGDHIIEMEFLQDGSLQQVSLPDMTMTEAGVEICKPSERK